MTREVGASLFLEMLLINASFLPVLEMGWWQLTNSSTPMVTGLWTHLSSGINVAILYHSGTTLHSFP